MDDILEKTTINIDSDYANFTSDTEFYVDIIDDIKNCIYIKTLKTEVFVKANYPEQDSGDRVGSSYNLDETSYVENSIFNNKTQTEGDINIIQRNVFNLGDYLYVTLNDIHRINTVSKKITVKTFSDIKSNENENDYGLVWTKVDKTPIDYGENNENNLEKYDLDFYDSSIFAQKIRKLNTQLKENAKYKGNAQAEASTTDELNDKITFTKQDIITMGFADYVDYKKIIKQYTYAHLTLGDTGIIYRYVPTYIGYTKDDDRINKYTWEVLNTSDAEDADRLKYLYNSKGSLKNPTNNRVYNYQIQKEEMNTLKYYDCIYINKPTIHTNLLSSPICNLLSYKQELSGTSCGPNDTNTMVLNPILPELKRFNVKLWRINELGEHVEVPITKVIPEDEGGVFRVIMSFTVYYKRKKVTRV
jgi:hypothetical protein